MIEFSAILSVDCPKDVSLNDYRPKFGKWWITEKKSDDYEDVFGTGAKHRKYCAVLSKADLKNLIDQLNLRFDAKGGAIGFPGADPFYAASEGWVFVNMPVGNSRYIDALVSLWLTPLVSSIPKDEERANEYFHKIMDIVCSWS